MTGKVLLVDDDNRILAGYSRHFRKCFDLRTASEAKQGLEEVEMEWLHNQERLEQVQQDFEQKVNSPDEQS